MGLPQTSSRPRSKAGDTSETDLWSSLLDSVAGGKRLPEKHVVLLGNSSRDPAWMCIDGPKALLRVRSEISSMFWQMKIAGHRRDGRSIERRLPTNSRWDTPTKMFSTRTEKVADISLARKTLLRSRRHPRSSLHPHPAELLSFVRASSPPSPDFGVCPRNASRHSARLGGAMELGQST